PPFVGGAPGVGALVGEQRPALGHEAGVLPRHPEAPAAGGAPVLRGERRGARRLTAALAVVALSLIAWRWARAPEPLPPRTIAVFPFAVHGGENLAYLREGMVDLLSAKLEGAAGLQAIDPRSTVAAARRFDSRAEAPADAA